MANETKNFRDTGWTSIDLDKPTEANEDGTIDVAIEPEDEVLVETAVEAEATEPQKVETDSPSPNLEDVSEAASDRANKRIRDLIARERLKDQENLELRQQLLDLQRKQQESRGSEVEARKLGATERLASL